MFCYSKVKEEHLIYLLNTPVVSIIHNESIIKVNMFCEICNFKKIEFFSEKLLHS